MVTISKDADVVTLVVMFHTTPETQGEWVDRLADVAEQHSHHDGFVSCTVHRSLDGMRVAEYIQWQSMAHLQAMMATPGALAHTEGADVVQDGRPFEITSVTEAPVADAGIDTAGRR